MKIPCKIMRIDEFTSKKGNKCAFVWCVVAGVTMPFRILAYRDLEKIPQVNSDAYLTITADNQLMGKLELVY